MYRTFTQASNLLRRTLQDRGYDLTPEQCFVLVRVRELEGANQSDLAKRLFKDRHSITRILNVLEHHGLIERRPNQTDKRVFHIYLTAQGEALREELVPLLVGHMDRMYEGLAEEDLTMLRTILARIITNIEGKE